jgi:hypothetical protein
LTLVATNVQKEPFDTCGSLLVFDHIPKTAGTTFRRSYLTAALPRDERWILSGGDQNAEDLQRFLQLSPQRRRRIRVVAGHYADALREQLPDARFITIVRDPVDRVVSSYLHALFHPGGDELWPDVRQHQMSLRDFANKYEVPNAQTMQLLGEGCVDEHAIRQRLNERYALVGYTEAFDQFVFLLHLMEGLPLCLYNNRLVRRERSRYQPSSDDVEFVRQVNAKDLLLHRVVRAEFQQRMAALPSVARTTAERYLKALDEFRTVTGGDERQSVRLDEAVEDQQAVRTFEFVFNRPPRGVPAASRSVSIGARDRIHVVVADEGRHLFDTIQDPRVQTSTVGDAAQPNLVVFPCSRFRRFENVAAVTLPAKLLEQIAAGTVGLVFDSSLEGVAHKPDITAALHAVIHQLGAHPRQCVYVTQDRRYESDYRAHCAAIGVEPVSVLTHDYWIWFALDEFRNTGPEVFQQRLDAFRARGRRRARKFVSLNRTPRPTKILFLLRLLRDGLWDEGFISFGGFRRKPGAPGKDRPSAEDLRRALPGFDDLVDELAPQLDRLDGLGRVLLGLEQHGWKNIDLGRASTASNLVEYDRSWFSVITETEMRPHPSRITEKVIKPLVNFHPIIVLGNPVALSMIHDYGFVTFGELFGESYDQVRDPRQRFELAYEQVRRACSWSDDEWCRAEQRIEEKLVFNARWGLTEFPTSYRRRNDIQLVDRVRSATSNTA